MKFLPIVSTVLLASLSSAFALTDAEITPAALVGKTLTFTIDTAGGAFANTGSWTGTFGSPAFTVANVTGNTVGITTTHTTTLDGFTIVTLPVYVQGSGTTTIALYTSAGVGRYEMNFSPVGSAYQSGTFTIGATTVEGPEISVQQPENKELTDGSTSKKSIGTARVGKSISKKFTIENTGTATLKNLAITVDGKNKSEFTVSALGKTSVAKKATTTFVVTFKPKSIGVKNAALHIKSNDKDENPFDIKLTGTGAGIK